MLASVHQAKEAHISLNPCLRHPSSLLREPVWAVDSFWFDRMDKIFPESTHRFMTVHARIFFTLGEGGEGVWTFPGKFKFRKITENMLRNSPDKLQSPPPHTHTALEKCSGYAHACVHVHFFAFAFKFYNFFCYSVFFLSTLKNLIIFLKLYTV